MALGLSQLEIAFQEECGDADCGNVLGIDKLFSQFPIGPGFMATVGPRVGQEDMLALWPSAYPSDTILNVLTVNEAPAAYSKNLGPGAGIWWKQNALSISANYVAANGDCADSSQGGIGTAGSGATGRLQLAYGNERAIDHHGHARTNAFGLGGYLQPSSQAWRWASPRLPPP